MSDILSKVEKENVQKNVSESGSVEKFQIIFDNLDFFFRAKHMTSSNQNRSIHWVNLLAVKDSVTGQGIDNTKPIESVYELLNVDFIPSLQQNQELLADLARVITDNKPAFKEFKGVVVRHIPHRYSEIMTHKSEQVYQIF